MKLMLYQNGTTTDLSGLVSGLTWSGDKSTAARKLEFALITDAPGVDLTVRNGDHCELIDDDGQCRFSGMIVQVTQKSGSATIAVTAYDRGIYLSNNAGTMIFRNSEPADAARQICSTYQIPARTLATAGVPVTRKFAGVSLCQILNTLYSLAGAQTGKRYMIRFIGRDLEVSERIEQATNLVIQPGSNLMTLSTTRSITGLRNSVAIYSKDGALIQTVEDQASVALFGMMQHHMTQQDGTDMIAEANAYLQDHAEEQTVTVSALGSLDIMTGDTVVVRHPDTGLQGIFWVDSDVHRWAGLQHTMQLGLNLRNVAYTANAGSEVKYG